jgi:type III secretion system YscQ/HrcQ family protein
MVLAAIERLNRTLRFPAQFWLARGSEDAAAGAQRGILLIFAVGIAGLTGHFRIFLPIDFLSRCKPEASGEAALTHPSGLCWAFPVSVGFVDLLPSEIAQVGVGDALVIQPKAATLFPNDFSRGWTMEQDGSNFARFKFDKYFERGTSVDTSREAAAAASRPAIETLPLRLHVMLGEKEFTLADVAALSPGTILELEATKADPVRLMVNGKILGEGELVEVEGNLAVRVLRWRNP